MKQPAHRRLALERPEQNNFVLVGLDSNACFRLGLAGVFHPLEVPAAYQR